MSVTSTTIRNSVFLKLDFGATDTGSRIIKTLSLGALKNTAFSAADSTKAYAIVYALAPLLGYNIVNVHHFVTNQLTDSD